MAYSFDSSFFKESAYRASIAANNTAVSLLEKGCFSDALKTFKESLQLMHIMTKDPLDITGQPISGEQGGSAKVIGDKLSLSARRLARAKPRCTTVSIVTCEEDDGDFSTMKSSMEYGPSSTLLFPVRIRSDLEKMGGKRIPASIILYNQGLTLLLIYTHGKVGKEESRDQLLYGAEKTLSAAQAILEDCSSHCKNMFEKEWRMLMLSLVLNNLCQVFHRKNQTEKVDQVLKDLRNLRNAVEKNHFSARAWGLAPTNCTAPMA